MRQSKAKFNKKTESTVEKAVKGIWLHEMLGRLLLYRVHVLMIFAIIEVNTINIDTRQIDLLRELRLAHSLRLVSSEV